MINDLRSCISALESQGLLRHVAAEVDHTWELSAIMRWVYIGYPEDQRYAVVFDRVKGYDIPVVVGAIGGSYKTYAACLGIDPKQPRAKVMNDVRERWAKALDNPIEPVLVKSGPCKENILKGDQVNIHKFPIPVWTPEKDQGWDEGYGFLTSPYHVCKDPDTGVPNVGTYRNMVRKAPNELGMVWAGGSHMRYYYLKNQERGKATEIATVIGGDPAVGMASVTPVPLGMNEYAVAGGLRGAPVELVKCETVDLEVPANAEIVIEGRMRTEQERPYEWEGPFGEYTGYQGSASHGPVYEITCITHRNKPIYQAFISQAPPSESSKVRHIGHEALALRELRALGIPGIVDINMPEMAQVGVTIVSIRKQNDGHPGRIASALFGLPRNTKFVIITDDDVDIYDLDSIMWAMSFRTSLIPGRMRVYFYEGQQALHLDYSAYNSIAEAKSKKIAIMSGVVIDATRPFVPYPVVALPPVKYLKRARDAWQKTGLPPLLNTEPPRCIVMEEEYLEKGLAAKPEFVSNSEPRREQSSQ
ncbi:MAG: UbiD family decarboxylase [Dehalococcoidia bacterium]|nr:UbiD family decarboxylase [Dehalococcoidia bacterium]